MRQGTEYGEGCVCVCVSERERERENGKPDLGVGWQTKCIPAPFVSIVIQ